jgi:hypothetical protein
MDHAFDIQPLVTKVSPRQSRNSVTICVFRVHLLVSAFRFFLGMLLTAGTGELGHLGRPHSGRPSRLGRNRISPAAQGCQLLLHDNAQRWQVILKHNP